ncbi:MAG TPA: hypothetical protein VFZ18_08635 [Longimicrobiaceae bacterium]
MRRRRSGGGGAGGGCGAAAARGACDGRGAWGRSSEGGASVVVGVRGWGAGWTRRWTLRAALLAFLLAGGCGEEAPRGAPDAGGAEAPARSAAIPSGSASLPPSAGLELPDTQETGGAVAPEGPDEAQEADAEGARRVIRDYYAAIAAGNYERAYAMWEDGGRRSGQTFLEFAAGFTGTGQVRVQAGTPGRPEGAAGSRYVEVPVVVEATTRSGRRERFEGTYTLRRAVVDGATEGQRAWRIYEAEIERVE